VGGSTIFASQPPVYGRLARCILTRYGVYFYSTHTEYPYGDGFGAISDSPTTSLSRRPAASKSNYSRRHVGSLACPADTTRTRRRGNAPIPTAVPPLMAWRSTRRTSPTLVPARVRTMPCVYSGAGPRAGPPGFGTPRILAVAAGQVGDTDGADRVELS
jgi:hypothetical protein